METGIGLQRASDMASCAAGSAECNRLRRRRGAGAEAQEGNPFPDPPKTETHHGATENTEQGE